MLRIVVCVCFAAALARPEHDHARQEHDRARQRHDHRHDRRHELLPARSRDGVGMARGLIGPCGAVRVASAGEQVAVEAAATPITLSSAAARDNGRWPRSAGPLPPRLVGPVDALTVYSPLLELAPSSLFHGLRSAVHGPRANASRVLLLLQDNPNKRPWADEELRGERIQVDAGFARQIGIGNALDAYSSAFLEAAALDRRLVVQGRIYERLCALVTCGLAAAAPPGPADDVEDRNNCCFKWHGGRRVEDDLRPALARVLAALGCAIDGASRRSRDDAAGEALACARSRVPRRAATGDAGAPQARSRVLRDLLPLDGRGAVLDAGAAALRGRYDGDGARFARALLEPPRAPLFDAAVHLRTIACPAASRGRGAARARARPGRRRARQVPGEARQGAPRRRRRLPGGPVGVDAGGGRRRRVPRAPAPRARRRLRPRGGGLRLRGQRAREARARRGAARGLRARADAARGPRRGVRRPPAGRVRSHKRVIQRRFNMSVPRARVPETASTLRERSER